MTPTYKTILKPAKGIFKDKRSKFFGYAYPVANLNEINWVLADLKKEHKKARHHCYAYKLGVDGKVYRTNDDHEPSHSAGKPIMNQIESKELTNVIVVVVRYFGGALLGVSGLTNAYKQAASNTLANAKIIDYIPMYHYELYFDYTQMNQILEVVKKNNIRIINKDFKENCYLKIAIPQIEHEVQLEALRKFDNLEVTFIESK